MDININGKTLTVKPLLSPAQMALAKAVQAMVNAKNKRLN
jgi:hypothetical protein